MSTQRTTNPRTLHTMNGDNDEEEGQPEPGPLGRVVVGQNVVGVLEEGDGHQVGVGHQHGRDVEGGHETEAEGLTQPPEGQGPRHKAEVCITNKKNK